MGRPARVTREQVLGAGAARLRREGIRRDDARRHRGAAGRLAGGAPAPCPLEEGPLRPAMESEPAGEKLPTDFLASVSLSQDPARVLRRLALEFIPFIEQKMGENIARFSGPHGGGGADDPPPLRSPEEDLSAGPGGPGPRSAIFGGRGPAGRISLSQPRAGALAFLGSLQSYVFFHRVLRIAPPIPLDTYLDTVMEVWRRGALARGRSRMKRKTLLILLVARPRGGRRRLVDRHGAAARSRSCSRARSRRGTSRSGRSRAAGSRRSWSRRAPVAAGQPIVQFETDLIDLQIAAAAVEDRAGAGEPDQGPPRAAGRRDRERPGVGGERGTGAAAPEGAPREGSRSPSSSTTRPRRWRRPPGKRCWSWSGETGRRTSPPRGRPCRPRRGSSRYLERQRAESIVAAPAAGVIESMDLRPGDLVGPNQPVARMLEPSQIWVRVYVPEPQLGRVRVGQKAPPDGRHVPEDASFPGASSRSARRPSTRRATSRRSTSAWTRSSA